MAETKNRREQVKELIETGEHTKAAIAEILEVNPPSVSSQMTYLRWMGFFILADEDKKLRFVDEEEYNANQEAVKATRKAKGSASTKTPQEQADALAKTIKNQTTSLEKAGVKCDQINEDLTHEPEDDELLELKEEADANHTLLRIKLKRNVAKAADLPEPAAPEAEVADDADIDEDEDLL